MLKSLKPLIYLLPLLFITACGGDEQKSEREDLKKVEFNLTGNDEMKFNLNTMIVEEGDLVVVNLENIGKMAKNVMGHNFVLLKPGVDLAAFAAKSMASKDNEYIPAEEMGKIIVYSKLLGPGEKTVIEFDAPPKGAYKFICSFPGHYVTMQGTLIVR